MTVHESRLQRNFRIGNCWTESDFGGRRIYWCWNVRVGAMGLTVVRRTLIGRAS